MTGDCLPHWQQPEACYFITFRLADSLPEHMLREWREEKAQWLSARPSPLGVEDEMEYHRCFSSRIDTWLDAGQGSCLLAELVCRDATEEALRFFDGKRHELLAWIIMPNHVHACVLLHPRWSLEKVVFGWKRHSSGEINRRLGRNGQVWMHDYFDRLIRDEEHLRNVVRYIRRNPEKARLEAGRYTLWESDLARTMV